MKRCTSELVGCAQGEAQKIEKVLEVFARHYSVCNAEAITRHFNSSDTLFLLAYAVVMLNTDLHSRSVRSDKKMKLDAFIQNLAGACASLLSPRLPFPSLPSPPLASRPPFANLDSTLLNLIVRRKPRNERRDERDYE